MLLTLAIPTYNRAENLRDTLLEFIAQIEGHGLVDVEIVISDNCSTDNTSVICGSIATQYPSLNLRYYQNSLNLGFDMNVNELFFRAAGKYVWTFSDDDTPGPNALPYIVEQLRKREVRFAFVNYHVNVEGLLLPSRFGVGADCWLEARNVLKTIRFSNSLISSCIFSRVDWLNSRTQRFIGTLWIHFFVAREILQAGDALIIGQPMFMMMQSGLEKSRQERSLENTKEVEFFIMAHLKFLAFANELLQYGFDTETIALASNLGKREDIHQIINFKLTATKYSLVQLLETWRHFARFRKNTLYFWLVLTPLLYAPSWFFKLGRVGYRKLKSWLR